tara:strand:- start:300 stop:473 length:174 start_codon:yes stop_codon:yes gene_type:complete
MSKRRKSLNKTKQILEDIKKRTPKIVFTAKNLIVTLRNRSQLHKWLKIYPDGEYIIK